MPAFAVARAGRELAVRDVESHRREERRKCGRRGHGDRDRELGPFVDADLPVRDVRPAEAEEHARLEVRRVDDEPRTFVVGGQVLQGRVAVEVVLQDLRERRCGRGAWHKDAPDARRDVHLERGEGHDRLGELRLEVRRDVVDEGQVLPVDAEQPGDDRPARDARDPVQPGQQPELVEPSQRPDMEQHRSRPAAREAQPGRARLGRLLLVARDEVDGPRGGVAGDLDVVRAAPRRVVDHRIPSRSWFAVHLNALFTASTAS